MPVNQVYTNKQKRASRAMVKGRNGFRAQPSQHLGLGLMSGVLKTKRVRKAKKAGAGSSLVRKAASAIAGALKRSGGRGE